MLMPHYNGLSTVSTSGKCVPDNNNNKCHNDTFCSEWGYCGTTDLHRKNNKNSIYDGPLTVSTSSKCGPDNNNNKCHDNTYCSEFGYRGIGPKYYNSINSQYDGIINNDRCGINYKNKKCQSDRYCTDNGWCNTSNVKRDGNKNSNYDGPNYKEPLIVASLQLQPLQPNKKSII